MKLYVLEHARGTETTRKSVVTSKSFTLRYGIFSSFELAKSHAELCCGKSLEFEVGIGNSFNVYSKDEVVSRFERKYEIFVIEIVELDEGIL